MWAWKLLNSNTNKTAFFPQAFVMHHFGVKSTPVFKQTDKIAHIQIGIKWMVACFIMSILYWMFVTIAWSTTLLLLLNANVCIFIRPHIKCRWTPHKKTWLYTPKVLPIVWHCEKDKRLSFTICVANQPYSILAC